MVKQDISYASVATIKTLTKSNLGRKGQQPIIAGGVRTGTRAKKLNVGTKAEAMEEFSLLPMTCSTCFLIYPRISAGVGTAYPDLDPLIKSLIKTVPTHSNLPIG